MYDVKNNVILEFFSENKYKPWFILFVILILIRVILSFIQPQFSSDFLRNLFYGEAFWNYGFQIYDLSPEVIDPNYNILDPSTGWKSYPSTAFDYPIVQILFWAIVVLIPFSLVTGKWILLVFDIANFFLIRDLLSEKGTNLERNGVSLIYFAFMIIISTIEGQPEGITLFFMLLSIKLLKNFPLLSYFALALGTQWKYVPIILLPFLIFVHRKNLNLALKGIGVFIITNILLSFPVLISDYVMHYLLYAGELPNNQIASNPLAWIYTFNYLSSFLLWIIIIYVGYYLIKNKEQIGDFLPLLPILLFLKYYRFAFPWYWLWLIPGMLVIKKEPRITIWLSFAILFPIAVIDFISVTDNWNFLLNYLNLG
ncbi:MAG: hypothetical protein ACW981_11045 [Candidatus Hodarchaeales archaeon]|jgi:hypothetical protein